ncbi:MAG TPA: cyclohexanone monooxygenase [Acidimicrobiaceae bacterium]|nr:cyclohexanone monooxygenase [Acidimicrobiaceae bacterium]
MTGGGPDENGRPAGSAGAANGSAAGSAAHSYDVIVVGAGFAGMYMLHKLRGLGFDAVVLERASGVGGTWYWNRYPGARCDVESLQYSYSFDDDLQQEWEWTERYSSQPEILRYLNHIADRFGLRAGIRFDTAVTAVSWDDGQSCWHVGTQTPAGTPAAGAAYRGRFVVMATGCLSSTNTPDFAGLDDFAGPVHHTGSWPHDGVDFAGRSVGVVGTGSSAVQAIPVIARRCRRLTVFQRTPNYSIPARNEPLAGDEQRRWKSRYGEQRARALRELAAIAPRIPTGTDSAKAAADDDFAVRMDERWEVGGFTFYGAYNDIVIDKESNERVAGYVRSRIADVVDDPATAALLSPDNTIACKRPCLDTDYFETFNLGHVSLVDVSATPIDRITVDGVAVGDRHYPVDMLVLATGFDAMTGTLLSMNITGRNGLTLNEKWRAGPRTYLGLGVPGFPNMFTVSGPGSPSVLTNMIPSIEQHVDWIGDCLTHLRDRGATTIEATVEAENDWVDHVNGIAGLTLYPTCNSWYLGANIPGKTRVFMPLIGFPPYVETCDEVAADGYRGFDLA